MCAFLCNTLTVLAKNIVCDHPLTPPVRVSAVLATLAVWIPNPKKKKHWDKCRLRTALEWVVFTSSRTARLPLTKVLDAEKNWK